MKIQHAERPKEKKQRPKPTARFRHWWMPTGYNQKTGAQIGGHPDALRKCVRTDTNAAAYFGVRVEEAWECQAYRDEYHQWLKDGMLDREYEVDGTAAPIERQKQIWHECLAALKSS